MSPVLDASFYAASACSSTATWSPGLRGQARRPSGRRYRPGGTRTGRGGELPGQPGTGTLPAALRRFRQAQAAGTPASSSFAGLLARPASWWVRPRPGDRPRRPGGDAGLRGLQRRPGPGAPGAVERIRPKAGPRRRTWRSSGGAGPPGASPACSWPVSGARRLPGRPDPGVRRGGG